MTSRPRLQVTSGPRVDPHVVGGEPLTILAFEEWMKKSVCTDIDPELFYPTMGDSTTSRAAKRICQDCPVRDECLALAVKNREMFGIWGGMSYPERRKFAARQTD